MTKQKKFIETGGSFRLESFYELKPSLSTIEMSRYRPLTALKGCPYVLIPSASTAPENNKVKIKRLIAELPAMMYKTTLNGLKRA